MRILILAGALLLGSAAAGAAEAGPTNPAAKTTATSGIITGAEIMETVEVIGYLPAVGELLWNNSEFKAALQQWLIHSKQEQLEAVEARVQRFIGEYLTPEEGELAQDKTDGNAEGPDQNTLDAAGQAPDTGTITDATTLREPS